MCGIFSELIIKLTSHPNIKDEKNVYSYKFLTHQPFSKTSAEIGEKQLHADVWCVQHGCHDIMIKLPIEVAAVGLGRLVNTCCHLLTVD